MNTSDVKRVLEGALLCASKPLTVSELRQLFSDDVPVSPDTVRALLESLREEWRGRPVQLAVLAIGWRFQSPPHIARYVMRLHPEKTPKYSRAVMETLAIIAYRQPVTRGDIEEIRGVTVSSQIIRTLEERGWIDQIGVKDVPGRPALFATTRQFLDDVGLRSLTELPALDDGDPAGAAAAAAPLLAEQLEVQEVSEPSQEAELPEALDPAEQTETAQQAAAESPQEQEGDPGSAEPGRETRQSFIEAKPAA